MKKTTLFLIIACLMFSCSSDDNVVDKTNEIGKNISVEISNSNDNSKVSFTSNEDVGIIKIKAPSSISWYASIDNKDSWCKVSPIQGNGDREIKISVTPNEYNEQRRTILTLTFSEKNKKTTYWNIDIIQLKVEGINLVVKPSEAGTLNTMIRKEAEGKLIEELTINGKIDYSDYDTIRSMRSLKKLNLKNATIVTGKRFDGKVWHVSPSDVIDEIAFSSTTLESIILPDGVTSIKNRAFYNAKNLKEIVLPPNLAYLGERCFSSCISLTNIELPDIVSYMGSYLFEYCAALETVSLPEGIKDVPEGLFQYCNNLSSIKNLSIVDNDISSKKLSIVGNNISIGKYAFRGCEKIESVLLKATNYHVNSSLTIESSSFSGCINLKKIILDDSESSLNKKFYIERSAFDDCPIEEAYFNLKNNPSKNRDILFMDSKYIQLCRLYVKRGTLKNYNDDNNWKSDLSKLRSIEEYDFK